MEKSVIEGLLAAIGELDRRLREVERHLGLRESALDEARLRAALSDEPD